MRKTLVAIVLAMVAFTTPASARDLDPCEDLQLGLHTNPGGALTLTYAPLAEKPFDAKVYRGVLGEVSYLVDLDPVDSQYVDTDTTIGTVYTYFVFKVPHGASFDPEDPWAFDRCEIGTRSIPAIEGVFAVGLTLTLGVLGVVYGRRKR